MIKKHKTISSLNANKCHSCAWASSSTLCEHPDRGDSCPGWLNGNRELTLRNFIPSVILILSSVSKQQKINVLKYLLVQIPLLIKEKRRGT